MSKINVTAAALAASNKPKPIEPVVEPVVEPVADAITMADFAGVTDEPLFDPDPDDALPGEEDDDVVEPVAEPAKPSPAPVAVKNNETTFVSTNHEQRCFPVNMIRSGWYDGGTRICWRVSADKLDSFRLNPHVKSGRIAELA